MKSLADVPALFSSEDEEREWWATHDFTSRLVEDLAASANDSQKELRQSQIEGLIREGLAIIPEYTPRMGIFSNVPGMGYTARHPGDWQSEVLSHIEQWPAAAVPDGDEIIPLVRLLNEFSNVHPGAGVRFLTLTSVLGYAVLEMLLRRLTPAINESGFLVRDVPEVQAAHSGQRVSSLEMLLQVFVRTSSFKGLATDFESLNGKLDLYRRLQDGRNHLMHGNISHSFEGLLLVLIIDLIILRVALAGLEAP